MYREETIINGILHTKSTPKGEWIPASMEYQYQYLLGLCQKIMPTPGALVIDGNVLSDMSKIVHPDSAYD
jgi:hypothetical protein